MKMIRGVKTIKPYIAVKPTPKSRDHVYRIVGPILQSYNVPGTLRPEAYHCTVVHSAHSAVESELQMQLNPNNKYLAQIIDAQVFTSKGDSLALVLVLNSIGLHRKHTELHRIDNVLFAYDSYKPHITVAYNPHKMPDADTITIQQALPIYRVARKRLVEEIDAVQPSVLLTGEKLVGLDSEHITMYQREHWFSDPTP